MAGPDVHLNGYRQIAENAGYDGAVVASRLFDQMNISFGFNAATDTYENLIAAGVIDPTKVVRTVLLDAASVGAFADHDQSRDQRTRR